MTTQKFYYGNPVSQYGLEHYKVDYATFAKAFNHVSCDFEALSKAAGYDFEPVGGSELYYELDGITYTPEEMEEKKEELEAHLEEVEEMEETPDTLEEIASIEKDKLKFLTYRLQCFRHVRNQHRIVRARTVLTECSGSEYGTQP